MTVHEPATELRCSRCGCGHFYTVGLRAAVNAMHVRKECRFCHRPVTVREPIEQTARASALTPTAIRERLRRGREHA